MNRRLWIFSFIMTAVVTAAFLWNIVNGSLSDGVNDKPEEGVTVSVWVFSKGWDALISEFQKKHPQITIDLRSFRTEEQLYKELMASISAGAAPQLAEIHSFYGIPELALSGAVSALSDQELPVITKLVRAFSEPFRYEGKLWAMPVGGSVPVLYYREELMKRAGLTPSGFHDWFEVEKAASLPLKEEAAFPEPRWGLAIDKELPWYAENISGGVLSTQTLDLWARWVHKLRIMAPLSHPMAASDFISGKVGVFASSSDKLPMIEKYIGGKFQFDLSRFPAEDSAGLIPIADALVMMYSSPVKENAARTLAAFMAEESAQALLWSQMGYIPSRSDIVLKLEEESSTSVRQKSILNTVRYLKVRKPAMNEHEKWVLETERLEQLELP